MARKRVRPSIEAKINIKETEQERQTNNQLLKTLQAFFN